MVGCTCYSDLALSEREGGDKEKGGEREGCGLCDGEVMTDGFLVRACGSANRTDSLDTVLLSTGYLVHGE